MENDGWKRPMSREHLVVDFTGVRSVVGTHLEGSRTCSRPRSCCHTRRWESGPRQERRTTTTARLGKLALAPMETDGSHGPLSCPCSGDSEGKEYRRSHRVCPLYCPRGGDPRHAGDSLYPPRRVESGGPGGEGGRRAAEVGTAQYAFLADGGSL